MCIYALPINIDNRVMKAWVGVRMGWRWTMRGKMGGGISVITLNNKNKKAILTINLVIILKCIQ